MIRFGQALERCGIAGRSAIDERNMVMKMDVHEDQSQRRTTRERISRAVSLMTARWPAFSLALLVFVFCVSSAPVPATADDAAPAAKPPAPSSKSSSGGSASDIFTKAGNAVKDAQLATDTADQLKKQKLIDPSNPEDQKFLNALSASDSSKKTGAQPTASPSPKPSATPAAAPPAGDTKQDLLNNINMRKGEITDLQNTANQYQNDLNNATDPTKKARIQADIDDLNKQIKRKQDDQTFYQDKINRGQYDGGASPAAPVIDDRLPDDKLKNPVPPQLGGPKGDKQSANPDGGDLKGAEAADAGNGGGTSAPGALGGVIKANNAKADANVNAGVQNQQNNQMTADASGAGDAAAQEGRTIVSDAGAGAQDLGRNTATAAAGTQDKNSGVNMAGSAAVTGIGNGAAAAAATLGVGVGAGVGSRIFPPGHTDGGGTTQANPPTNPQGPQAGSSPAGSQNPSPSPSPGSQPSPSPPPAAPGGSGGGSVGPGGDVCGGMCTGHCAPGCPCGCAGPPPPSIQPPSDPGGTTDLPMSGGGSSM